MNPLNLAHELLFSKRALDKPCYVGPGYTLHYRDLDRAVRRQAARLARLELKAGQRVVIALDDGPDLAVIFFATLALGAVPVVINAKLDSASLRHIVADADPAIVFGKRSQTDVVRAALDSLEPIPQVFLLEADWWRMLFDAHDDDGAWNDVALVAPDAPAVIQYTSGTTGRAKGVVHTTRGILACCESVTQHLKLVASDILYSVPKAFFGFGMGNSLFFPLYLGATAVFDPAWPTPEQVADNLRRFRPTVLFAVPTLYRLLLDAGFDPDDSRLRLAFSAGAQLPVATSQRWRAQFGIDLHDGIGSTELCHIFVTSFPDALRAGSLGRPLPGYDVRIVDELGDDVPRGATGVLLVRSPAMATGYWRRQQDDAARFAGGWCRTGDLFSQDNDGYLYCHGREDDRFKVYGRWVVPAEIEAVLSRLMPAFGDCFVVPGRDGSGEDRPVLCTCAPCGADTIELVLAELNANLAGYKRPVKVLVLDALPLTPNGKPNRRALAQLASEALQRDAHAVLAENHS